MEEDTLVYYMASREHYFGFVESEPGSRAGQVMFLADADHEWVPITPLIDLDLARDIAARANRSAGVLIRKAEIQVESLQKRLEMRGDFTP